STVGIVPPQIYTLLQSDRLFSDILINMTTNNMHGGNGNQYIINATHSRNYYITNYMQGSNPGYEVVNSIELYPAQYGTTAVPNALDNSGVAPSKQLVNSNYLGANAFFNFNTIGAAAINLFSFIKSVSYNSNLNLSFANTTLSSSLVSTTYNALGYNRLILMFRDRFNNTIALPLDLDIAKISTLKLNVTPVVNTINPNKTMLEINGLATYLFNGNTYPINGIPVYLYYDRNINFALHNPNQDTANAILCAFASNTAGIPSNCTIANPINPLQSKNATVKTFATAYNALGDCGPAPNSLLTVESTNCNIYGNDGTKAIPNTCQAAGQYCLPQFSNGTGVCTSQLGLIGSVNTNANGQFSLQTTVCGIGNADILASLYGEPGPEPNTVIQTPISLSANAALTCSNPSGCIKTSVYNYFVSPSSAAQSVPIGEFELSYGAISSILASIIAIAAIAAYAIIARSRKAIYRKKGIK
ncbi:MAG: hypothetical protein KGH59_01415, partial [Candidatus Micrarchaeota archaeon]|nr:hypothetical protein [Candidatus Micrarchaeota archaeon]